MKNKPVNERTKHPSKGAGQTTGARTARRALRQKDVHSRPRSPLGQTPPLSVARKQELLPTKEVKHKPGHGPTNDRIAI